MKLIRKVFTGLSAAAALTLGGAVLLFSLPSTGWKAMTVQTGSMSPNIPTGSMVFVHRVPTSSLKVGDVITYTSMYEKNKTISHRITQFYSTNGVPGFVTKGDANKVPDSPIVAGQVKGKVVASVPYLGKISKLLMTWPVIIALVYLPALFVMIGEMRRLAAYYKSLMPYKAAVILAREKAESRSNFGVAAVPIISLLLIAGSVVFALPVHALFTTNSVKLDNNNLIVTAVAPPNNGGGNTTNTSCQNNNNINVSNTSTQTATTGSANNSSNINSGGATTGNATNNSNSNTTVIITNGC